MNWCLRMRRFGMLAAVLLGFGSGAQAADAVTVGMVGKASTLNWPIYIGLAKQTFDAEKVKVDLVFIPSNAGLQQQLAAGSVHLGVASGLVDPIRAINRGSQVAIVRIDGQFAPYALLANSKVGSIKDLAGKTISVGGANDITRSYLERMLLPNGVKAGSYDLVYAGSTAARFAALQSGAADAAILTTPQSFMAEAAGFKNLGLAVEYAPDFPFSGSVANIAWAQANRETLKKFLSAYTKAIEWFYDDKNRVEAIEIMVKASGNKENDVAMAYDFLRKVEVFEKTGAVSKRKLKTVVDALTANGDLPAGFDAGRLVKADLANVVD